MNELGRAQVPFLFILDYELKHPLVLPLSDINANEIQYTIGKWSNAVEVNHPPVNLQFNYTPPKQTVFKKAFHQIQEELQAGNTYLANLCFRSKISCNWDLNTIFTQASAKYKLKYKDKFVFFSPETFVKIDQNIISSFPMKGTIDANLPDAQNLLLNDPKEEAEHATIVDLLRNDLSLVAKKVRLIDYKYLDLVKTNRNSIWQMSSKIQGILPKDYSLKIGNLIASLLPAGSISGAPKKKTIEIIKDTEIHSRGYYTGIAGIFDGSTLDSSVMIRFIEKNNKKLYYRSGGGITTQSQCDKEYQELQQKIYIPTLNKKPLLVETIRLQNGVFENLDWHQKRMDKSRLNIFDCQNTISLRERLSHCNYDFGSQLMRCRVVYDKRIKQIEFIPYHIQPVSSLQCIQLLDTATEETKYKWNNRALYKQMLNKKNNADDILIVRDNQITDTSICNIALWDGSIWWTPKEPLLKGTTRARLLFEGVLFEKRIKINQLRSYQKIRLFNAMIPWEQEKDIPINRIRSIEHNGKT